jgi:hypothetical protein
MTSMVMDDLNNLQRLELDAHGLDERLDVARSDRHERPGPEGRVDLGPEVRLHL